MSKDIRHKLELLSFKERLRFLQLALNQRKEVDHDPVSRFVRCMNDLLNETTIEKLDNRGSLTTGIILGVESSHVSLSMSFKGRDGEPVTVKLGDQTRKNRRGTEKISVRFDTETIIEEEGRGGDLEIPENGQLEFSVSSKNPVLEFSCTRTYDISSTALKKENDTYKLQLPLLDAKHKEAYSNAGFPVAHFSLDLKNVPKNYDDDDDDGSQEESTPRANNLYLVEAVSLVCHYEPLVAGNTANKTGSKQQKYQEQEEGFQHSKVQTQHAEKEKELPDQETTSIFLIKKQDTAFPISFGKVDDSEFNLGTLTRTLAGITLMNLLASRSQEFGKWKTAKMDEKLVYRILGTNDSIGAALKTVFKNHKGPNLHQLLTDSSGLPDRFHLEASKIPEYFGDTIFGEAESGHLENFSKKLSETVLTAPPGSLIIPSEIAWVIIGRLIARLSNSRWAGKAIEDTARKMGLTTARYSHRKDKPSPIGHYTGVYEAARDLKVSTLELPVLIKLLVNPGGFSKFTKPRYIDPEDTTTQRGMAGWIVSDIPISKDGEKTIKTTRGVELFSQGGPQSDLLHIVYIPSRGVAIISADRNLELASFIARARNNIVKALAKTIKTRTISEINKISQLPPLSESFLSETHETPESRILLKHQAKILSDLAHSGTDLCPVIGYYSIHPRVTVVERRKGKDLKFVLCFHAIKPNGSAPTVYANVPIYPDFSTGYYRMSNQRSGTPVSIDRKPSPKIEMHPSIEEALNKKTLESFKAAQNIGDGNEYFLSIGDCSYVSKPWKVRMIRDLDQTIKDLQTESDQPRLISPHPHENLDSIQKLSLLLDYLKPPVQFTERQKQLVDSPDKSKQIEPIGGIFCGYGRYFVPGLGCVPKPGYYGGPVAPYYRGHPYYYPYGSGPLFGINVGVGRRPYYRGGRWRR